MQECSITWFEHCDMGSVSSCVSGIIVKAAFEWDPNAIIPEEFSDVDKVVLPNVCGSRGASKPTQVLPVRQGSFCRKECQQNGGSSTRKHVRTQVQGQAMNPMRTFVDMRQGMHESIAI
jgi:hypothetical protein